MKYCFYRNINSICYEFELQFVKGKFESFSFKLPDPPNKILQRLIEFIDFNSIEKTIENLKTIQFLLSNDKNEGAEGIVKINYVGIWCNVYLKERGHAYKVMTKEGAMLVTCLNDCTEQEAIELFTKFFHCTEHWANPMTISNFVVKINPLRDLIINPKVINIKSKFPSYWTKQEEQKYAGTELTEYWTHLRILGWKKKGNIWEAPAQTLDKIAQNIHNNFKVP